MDQPGKSNLEEKVFLRAKVGDGGEDLDFVSVTVLLEDLTQSKITSSVPSLSVSESFSPSTFMSVDTRGGVSTFGGVNQLGDTRQINLRSCSSISIPSYFAQPATPAKTKRVNKWAADSLVKLFLADSTADHCDGKVGHGSNIQTCVTPARFYLVCSHATKAETFEANRFLFGLQQSRDEQHFIWFRLFLLKS